MNKLKRYLVSRSQNTDSGCRIWTISADPCGYGKGWWNKRRVGAHRLSWTAFRGPIPAGMSVLHHCDNPLCIKPKHLFLGTQADNVRDMARKGRLVTNPAVGSGHYGAKLDEEKVWVIRIRSAYGAGVRDLAVMLGVNVETVRDVLRGRTWKHVA